MKKYLMSGIAAIAIATAFTSCSKSTDLYEEGRKEKDQAAQQEQQKIQSYSDAFENEFGKIDPNQNWGFTDQNNKAAGTRYANVNRNEWGTGNGVGGHVAVPKNVNDPSVNSNERTLVYNYFNKKREGAVNENNVNWTDYFITEVWKGEDSYYDYNQYNWTEAKGQEPQKGDLKDNATKNVLGSDKMNHLQVLKGEGSIDANGNLVGAWEHANDFNNGNHSSEYGSIKGHTFMENSGTLDFAYHNSIDSKYHNEYIIIPGAEIDPSLAGYYYVGFDFSAYKGYVQEDSGVLQQKDGCVDRDWVFTDWIVRISPAEFNGQQRIFVEDLITEGDLSKIDPSDWDFNDLVFDAYIQYNEYDKNNALAIITVRAAGGTLPLTIAGKEVHQMFGVSQETMVNTGSGAECAPFQIRLSGTQVTSANATDIPVVVTAKNGQTITLTAKVGEATQKIAAPYANHVKWLKERIHIKNGYPTFMDYVGDATKIWYVPANDGSLFQKWY